MNLTADRNISMRREPMKIKTEIRAGQSTMAVVD
jgi:hypothetical protein